MNWLVPMVLYLSAAVFLLGMGWRVWTWMRAPVPLKIVLTPAPKTTGGVVKRLGAEGLFFRSLWSADPLLWAAAWLFHVSLVLLAGGHIVGLLTPNWIQSRLDLNEEQFGQVAYVVGGIVGILALAPLLVLLLRRLLNARVRYISTAGDYAALGLLLLVIVTGNHLRFGGGPDITQAREFVSALVRLHPVAPPLNPTFIAHLLLVSLLLVYIPFSKLLHLGALIFSPTLNQRNDPRERRHG